MNYLTEIKLFYDWLETHPLTPSAIALWHGLMFMANRAGWEEVISIPLSAFKCQSPPESRTHACKIVEYGYAKPDSNDVSTNIQR